MKRLITFLTLLALAATARAELTVISSAHREADSFKRFSEYLTGKPSEGRYEIIRSDDSSRDGFYVSLLASDKAAIKQVSTVKVQFVRAGTLEIESFEKKADSLKKKRILVGFTESEWHGSKNHPMAWKIELLDSAGTVLESAQSFLWSD